MQDRYVGHVGDFVKYGLLRAIRGIRHLGIAWYLHPDAGPAGDGRHTDYLRHPGDWRHLDPKLFDTLKGMIPHRRSVASLQRSGILDPAVYAADRLTLDGVKVGDRASRRQQWFNRCRRQLALVHPQYRVQIDPTPARQPPRRPAR